MAAAVRQPTAIETPELLSALQQNNCFITLIKLGPFQIHEENIQ
jgi:hypothetical protein